MPWFEWNEEAFKEAMLDDGKTISKFVLLKELIDDHIITSAKAAEWMKMKLDVFVKDCDNNIRASIYLKRKAEGRLNKTNKDSMKQAEDDDFSIPEDWTEKTMQVFEMFRDEWQAEEDRQELVFQGEMAGRVTTLQELVKDGIISNELADKYNISSNI